MDTIDYNNDTSIDDLESIDGNPDDTIWDDLETIDYNKDMSIDDLVEPEVKSKLETIPETPDENDGVEYIKAVYSIRDEEKNKDMFKMFNLLKPYIALMKRKKTIVKDKNLKQARKSNLLKKSPHNSPEVKTIIGNRNVNVTKEQEEPSSCLD